MYRKPLLLRRDRAILMAFSCKLSANGGSMKIMSNFLSVVESIVRQSPHWILRMSPAFNLSRTAHSFV